MKFVLLLVILLAAAAVRKGHSKVKGSPRHGPSRPRTELELLEPAAPASDLVKLLFGNIVLAVVRCYLTAGQPYERAVKERTKDDDFDLPAPSLPSLSALLHLAFSLLASVLVASFSQLHTWLEKAAVWQSSPSLRRALAVHTEVSDSSKASGHRKVISKLSPAGHVPAYFRRDATSLLDLDEDEEDEGEEEKEEGKVFVVDEQSYLITRDLKIHHITPRVEGLGLASAAATLSAHLGRGGLSEERAALRLRLYGPNQLYVPLPSLQEQLRRRFLHPFALLQMSHRSPTRCAGPWRKFSMLIFPMWVSQSSAMHQCDAVWARAFRCSSSWLLRVRARPPPQQAQMLLSRPAPPTPTLSPTSCPRRVLSAFLRPRLHPFLSLAFLRLMPLLPSHRRRVLC